MVNEIFGKDKFSDYKSLKGLHSVTLFLSLSCRYCIGVVSLFKNKRRDFCLYFVDVYDSRSAIDLVDHCFMTISHA